VCWGHLPQDTHQGHPIDIKRRAGLVACARSQDAHRREDADKPAGCTQAGGRGQACRTHTGGRTRTSRQDAHKGRPIGVKGRAWLVACARSQGAHRREDADKPAGSRRFQEDADKQRPYYGRVLGAWVHVPRIFTPGQLDGLVAGHGCAASTHPFAPCRPALVRFTRNTRKTYHYPSIVGTPLVCVLHACTPNVPDACPSRPESSTEFDANGDVPFVRHACLHTQRT
jgi:hypothetical protein